MVFGLKLLVAYGSRRRGRSATQPLSGRPRSYSGTTLSHPHSTGEVRETFPDPPTAPRQDVAEFPDPPASGIDRKARSSRQRAKPRGHRSPRSRASARQPRLPLPRRGRRRARPGAHAAEGDRDRRRLRRVHDGPWDRSARAIHGGGVGFIVRPGSPGPGSSTFAVAQRACKRLLPNGWHRDARPDPGAAAVERVSELRQLANACAPTAIPNFPDPSTNDATS